MVKRTQNYMIPLDICQVESKSANADSERETAANREFVAKLETDCTTKVAEHAERTKMRNEEILAVMDTIKILNNDDSLEAFKAGIKPKAEAAAFLQRSVRSNGAQKALALVAKAQQAAKSKVESSNLSLLSSMIKVLIIFSIQMLLMPRWEN